MLDLQFSEQPLVVGRAMRRARCGNRVELCMTDNPNGEQPRDRGEVEEGSRSLADQFSDLAQSLEQEDDVQTTLDAIVQAAVCTIPGAEHVSLSRIERRSNVVTLAATSDLARRVDQAQYETEQGPCLSTLFERKTDRLPDLAAEDRWPHFAARARDIGVGSMLSVQLFVRGDDLGALNIHGEKSHAFDEESEHVALLFASHAAVAMVGAQEQDHLRRAVSHREQIGQATGMLMERFQLSPDKAFQVLVRASQNSNRKLRDVADELVQHGTLPAVGT